MRPRALILLLSVSFLVGGIPAVPAQGAITTTASQSTYVPQSPVRVLDTRDGTGGRLGSLGAGQTYDLALPVPTGATAAVLNVTATGATTATVIKVYPGGASVPATSNLNVLKGATVANLVVSQLDGSGRVRFHNDNGQVQLVADLAGYYVEGDIGDGYHARTPVRLLDTRSTSTPLEAGVPQGLDTRVASSGVPTDASAVVLNVTVVGPSQSTDVRLYPGPTPPTVSNLNATKGQTVANLVVVKVESGVVNLLSQAGSTHVVVDLMGWYTPGAGDVFHPLAPYRALDTRTTGPKVSAGSPRGLTLSGAGQIPWHATALALTVTAVNPSASTDVTVYPESASPPTASNINLLRGQVVPNAAFVAAGKGGVVRLKNAVQTVDLVVDVSGWFGPPGDGYDISWPQCTSADATTSTHPASGSFAVIGVTHGTFAVNSCLGDEWSWASSLAGSAAVYVNTDANSASSQWRSSSGCSTGQATSSCGTSYGQQLAAYALAHVPAALDGGKPFVWLDVEGPYPGGPYWTNSVAANRAVLEAAVGAFVHAGYRVGIYSDYPTSTSPDWKNIMGVYSMPTVQNWVFRPYSASAPSVCTPSESFSGGPVVMEQISTVQSGEAYDVDHAC
ncbi:MAG: N-acetylmuramoyl-L-alanine amidase [Frankiales bacterium]|nr:N-acetylmuramoyl-L-alanine amidase [Frankiales bacterium]